MSRDHLSNPHANPLREVWAVAWPTVLTMTSFTIMQFVDQLMVGQVGPTEIAAQGSGAIWAFVPLSFSMGLLTVVNTWVSQNAGAGNMKRTSVYGWTAVWMALAIWVLVLLPWAGLLPSFFDLVHPHASDELRSMESQYGQILMVGGAFMLGARGIHQFFFGTLRPGVVTVSAVCGNIVNIFVSYLLVFGEIGLPQHGLPGFPGVAPMGVAGAAWGTVAGVFMEFLVPMAIFLSPSVHRQYATRSSWRPNWRATKDVLRLGWPSALQWGNEIVCWSIFMTVLVGRFGESSLTAGWICLSWMRLSFMPANGFGVAAKSLVGRYIGAGEPDTAASRARLSVFLTMVWMTVCAGLFIIFRHDMIAMFIGGDTLPEEAQQIVEIGAGLMLVVAFFQTIDALGIVYSGALGGAGDVIWPGVLTVIYAWGPLVLGGWLLAVYVPEWGAIGPWIAAAVYVIALGFTMAWRFERGRWRRIELLQTGSTTLETHP
ncbi:MAG: MATE family efflux transporter [Phycisphaerales bacterium]|nr:MATE family efflux transporter [Phycisphaerales bacterium]